LLNGSYLQSEIDDRFLRYGEGPDQAPDVDALVALDAEVRAAFAVGAAASQI